MQRWILHLKKPKMAAVLKSASDICRKMFVNILHFLSLRTKMALAQPILELDLLLFLQVKIESFVYNYVFCIEVWLLLDITITGNLATSTTGCQINHYYLLHIPLLSFTQLFTQHILNNIYFRYKTTKKCKY